ncbi:MAG: serpin family protein, partial [Deltaproteobacteria bacterium]|nr:serpin family protein [Deltaproteobacteria bacterium]
MLTNAVYFKGAWKESFNPEYTRDGDFWVTPAGAVKVPLMYQEEKFGYLETKELQALEMPYGDGELSMVV